MRAGSMYYLLWTVVRHNRKDPGKTPFTNSQDTGKFLFLVPGKAGQFILQQIQQPKMALKQ